MFVHPQSGAAMPIYRTCTVTRVQTFDEEWTPYGRVCVPAGSSQTRQCQGDCGADTYGHGSGDNIHPWPG